MFRFVLSTWTLVVLCSGDPGKIPEVSYDDLKDLILAKDFEPLKDPGGKFSSLVIHDIPVQDYVKSVLNLFKNGPECIGTHSGQDLELSNGAVRKTFATESGSYPECLEHEMATVGEGFDLVEVLVSKLIQKIANRDLEYFDPDHMTSQSLLSAPIKDHIHVYTMTNRGANATRDDFSRDKALVPKHLDNGLFLLITPYPDHALQIEMSNGQTISTSWMDPGSILVMFGLGTPEWLLQHDLGSSRQFYPAPHGVPGIGGPLNNKRQDQDPRPRTVFARMKVAPGEAKPRIPPTGNNDNMSNEVPSTDDLDYVHLF